MKINVNGIFFDEYSLNLERTCGEKSCQKTYRIIDYYESSEDKFYPPIDYARGCSSECLECWLDLTQFMNKPLVNNDFLDLNISIPDDHSFWYDHNDFEEIDLGNIGVAYKKYIARGSHVALLPISRLVTDKSIFFPHGVMIYPQGRLDLNEINLCESNNELSDVQTIASGVDLDSYKSNAIIVLPINCDWNSILGCSHKKHLELIRTISEMIDRLCLDMVRFHQCKLTDIPDEGLPNSAGQIGFGSMMSSAMILKHGGRDAKLVSGAVFSHSITRGVGLFAKQLEWDCYPENGEVGRIAYRAISQYSQVLKTESASSRFIQAISLLEFLASPYDYEKFKKVKTIISRYVAQGPEERKKVLDRFEYYSGKKDPDTNEQIGLRTNIVHIGARLEELVHSRIERKEIFDDLDLCIRTVIRHMIRNSELNYDEYLKIRENL